MSKVLSGPELAAFRKLAPAEQIRQVRGQQVEREFTIERDGAVDEKKRTAYLSIASEAPYDRWWGTEVLSVTKDAIRDERLRKGAPLLVGHDTRQQVGVVESFEITADKKLRILARFGRSALAEEIFRDVLDGIRRNASVGYIIHDLVLEKQEEDVATYRVTDWEPLEGSIVAVPADPSVGVGRQHEAPPIPKRKDIMDPKDISPEVRAQIAAEERAKIEKEAREKTEREANTPDAIAKREQERVAAILKAGTEYKDLELANEIAKDPNATVETFKARLLEKQRSAQKPLATAATWPGRTAAPRACYFTYGKLQAFRDLPVEGGGVMKAEEAAHRAGMWLAAAIHNKDWAKKWCREHGMPLMYPRRRRQHPRDGRRRDPRAERERALRRRRAGADRDGGGDHQPARHLRRRAALARLRTMGATR
jgi:hypothetical protein